MLYFALVEPGEEFDPAVHSREDLTVLDLSISWSESKMARADIAAVNFRTPLPGKRLLIIEGGILLFNGVITSNRGRIGPIIDIEAVARPADADARLNELCELLKSDPRKWDPLAVPKDKQNDISEVLAAHGMVECWDRVTHQVKAADIFVGEDYLGELRPLEGTLNSEVTLPPSEIRLTATASWRQLCRAQYDVGPQITGLETMTPDGLLENWPEVGDKLGTGFYVVESSLAIATDLFGREKVETVEVERSLSGGYHIDPAFMSDGITIEKAQLVTLDATLVVDHAYELRRSEGLKISAPLVLQPGLVTTGPEEINIQLQELTEKVSAPVWKPHTSYSANQRVSHRGNLYRCRYTHFSMSSFDKDYPAQWQLLQEDEYLLSRRRSSFFSSVRGREVAEYMLERVRARARHASRCVRLSLDCAMPAPGLVTSDCYATVRASGLGGGAYGVATGKVVEYSLNWSNGRRDAHFVLACAPGTGEPDDLALGDRSTDAPEAAGGVDVDIRNRGAEQKAYFEEHGVIPDDKDDPNYLVTEIDLEGVPAPTGDLEGTTSYATTGKVGVYQGVFLT